MWKIGYFKSATFSDWTQSVDQCSPFEKEEQARAINRLGSLCSQFNERLLYSQLPRFSGIPDERFYQVYP